MSTTLTERADQSARRCHDGFVTVLERLYALREDGEEAPASVAFDRACGLLIHANSLMQSDFPRGTASTEDDGGVRIEWRRAAREIKLITAPSPGGLEYVYQEEGEAHSLDQNVTPALLARWLDWLTQA